IEAIRQWRSWHGLRHWAALQRLFTAAGRTGRIRWNLNGHLDALGLSERSRRAPSMRRKIANEVEALTRLEIAVYNTDGSLRLRGPILAVTQRGEALRGSEWALEGMELVIHPVLYEGVRKTSGELGTLWTPAPVELAQLDERTHPYALALGLLLPIRWRWDHGSGHDHIVLSGRKLLETAGIPLSAQNPFRAWQTLERNLEALQAIGGLGHVEWGAGEKHTLDGHCHLHPPTWVRDRLVHGLFPEEAGRDPELLTGADLAEWRRSLGLSQEALAGQLGLSERTIRRAETSPDQPLTSLLRKAIALFQGKELQSPKP
ncbi:MAG: helix-turn-helix transcriptional regulator, partial [Verrucomicrobia bacterium]|nr:helix-turn-helix transcriptional regulator [Verrucomicrobiota bacterium]